MDKFEQKIEKSEDLVIEITSVNNELVKQAAKLQQKKYRAEEEKFLIEGFKPIQEAYLAGIEIEQVFVLKEKSSKYEFLNPSSVLRTPSPARGEGATEFILTTEPVLKKISTTETAPEAVAIAKQKIFTLEDIKDAKKITLLENIKDLGNLGTILRTAKAFGQDAIILFGDTVDFYNPKCVRSAVGNLWKIPVVQIKDFSALKLYFEAHFKNFDRIATLPKSKGSIYLKYFSVGAPYLIMFGSEAEGLSNELINFATQKVTIEMNSDVESLNLSISVGVLLYKLTNQLNL